MSYRATTVDTTRLRADSARITELIDPGSAGADAWDAPVPGCPGWAVRDLIEHLGMVHRWANDCVRRSQEPTTAWQDQRPELADGELASWFADGAAALADALDAVPSSAPTWTPFPIDDPTLAVWIRRQTHETSLHRRDVEAAVGAAGPIDAELAADGIDEYFEVIVPRLVQRDGRELPAGSAHLHCTDTEGEWTVEVAAGDYVVDRTHRKGDAAVRATAQDLLLRLWGRDVPDAAFDVFGDAGVAHSWLGIGGN